MDWMDFMQTRFLEISQKVCVAVAWFGMICTVHAQTTTSPPAKQLSAPEALKDIQPAGQSCRREDVIASGNKSAALNPKETVPDMTCSMTATELNLWLLARDIIAIDTRPATEYAQYRIDGTVNLPSQDIKHKPHLSRKNIALIGTGKQERELFALCAVLKANGYKSVKVLQGGLHSWQVASLPLLGRVPTIDSMRALDSSQLLAETYFNANLMIVSSSRSDMASQIKNALTATSDEVDAMANLIEVRQKQKPNDAINSVVWIAPMNTKPETLTQLQAKLLALPKPLPLLVYTESTGEFQKFMSQQQAMWNAQARGPKQPACGV
jgi:rhodanese-related sulfurtransferase